MADSTAPIAAEETAEKKEIDEEDSDSSSDSDSEGTSTVKNELFDFSSSLRCGQVANGLLTE